MSEKRILILEPALGSFAGHSYNCTLALEQQAVAAGCKPLVLVSDQFKDAAGKAPHFIPAFSRSLYARKGWSRRDFETEVAHLVREAEAALAGQPGIITGIYIPTCDQVQIKAVAELVRRRVLPDCLAVLGWLLFTPRWNLAPPIDGIDPQLMEYRDAISLLQLRVGNSGQIRLCCETEAIRRCYSSIEELDLRLAPALSTVSMASRRLTRTKLIHFVIAGHANTAKGYDILPDAVAEVLSKTEKARFTLHGVSKGTDNPKAAEQALDRLSQMGSRVAVLRDELDSEAYTDLLGSANALLLPYKLPEYERRGSGLFNESEQLGIPVIAPAGADFARKAVAENRAVPMKSQSAQELAHAILEATHRIDELEKNCAAYSQNMGNCEAVKRVDEFLQHSVKPRAKISVRPQIILAPKFTVIVTNYNYSSYVEQCLSSVADQNFSDFECIIVDDNSTDGSRDCIVDFLRGSGDKRFQYVFLEENVGQLDAMIAGFQRASGNFVGFLDSDDAWAPDYIRAHLSAHLNPDFCAGMSCCDMMIIDHSSRLLTSTWKEMKKDRGSPAGESRSRLRPTCDEILDAKPPTFNPARDTISYERQSGRAAWMFSPTSACVYRSDLLGLMLPKSGSHFRISADYYLSMQASVLTGCLFIEAALAYYRVHGKNGFSIHPVVGGNWRPGIWDRENSRNYNRRIVEHIQSEVDAYVSVFGSHEVKAALEMFGEESASAAEPLRFASKTPKRRKTRFWKNMRRISRNAIGSK